jgi:DNA-binding transcriptional LysR family regulator
MWPPLHDEDYALVGAASLVRKHPLRRAEHAGQHVLLDIAADLPLFRYFVDAHGTRETWSFRKVELLGTIGAIRLRALHGAGIAVLPRYFIEADLRAGRLVRLMSRVSLQRDAFRLIWRTGHPREGELRASRESCAASRSGDMIRLIRCGTSRARSSSS